MKPSEIRKLSPAEIRKRVQEKKRELMELRFQASIGQLSQNHRIRETKREIARLLTILREKELGIR
ncbi:50S ribosomal protein L29 [Marinithermus hydrothermalis]|nr:50S ribosomal protein L29 [Marinithermus hydrothermalis]